MFPWRSESEDARREPPLPVSCQPGQRSGMTGRQFAADRKGMGQVHRRCRGMRETCPRVPENSVPSPRFRKRVLHRAHRASTTIHSPLTTPHGFFSWTLAVLRTIAPRLILAAVLVGVVLVFVLGGLAPLEGDPVLMYQPIKVELARRSLPAGCRFGATESDWASPLVAESHVAAFYPPNWLCYRLCEVATAYRLTMWLHMIALLAATYALCAELGIVPRRFGAGCGELYPVWLPGGARGSRALLSRDAVPASLLALGRPLCDDRTAGLASLAGA